MTLYQRQSKKKIWGGKFTSPNDIVKLGGTLTGSPTVDREGIHLNGSSQYVTFPSTTQFNRSEFTIKLEFIPFYNYDVNSTFYIMDSNPTAKYSLIKYNNASSNNYVMRLGSGGSVLYMNQGAYSPYWKQGERNTSIIVCKSGASKGYLNGVSVGTSATAWNAFDISNITLGASYAGGSPFKGSIVEFSVYDKSWSAEDVAADYNNSLFNFQDKASLYLDMAEQTEDASGKAVTLDKSRYGRTVYLGDGSTSSTFPAFENPGMYHDGSTDYQKVVLNGALNNTGQTFVVCVKPNFYATTTTQKVFFDTVADGSTRYLFYKANTVGTLNVQFGNTTIHNSIAISTYQQYFNSYGVNVFVIASNPADNEFWLNSNLVAESSTAWTPKNPTNLYLGSTGTAHDFVGTYYHFSAYPFKLSPIQVREITNQLLSRYSGG